MKPYRQMGTLIGTLALLAVAATSSTAAPIEMQKFAAVYDGTLSQDDSQIAGTWKQGSASLPRGVLSALLLDERGRPGRFHW